MTWIVIGYWAKSKAPGTLTVVAPTRAEAAKSAEAQGLIVSNVMDGAVKLPATPTAQIDGPQVDGRRVRVLIGIAMLVAGGLVFYASLSRRMPWGDGYESTILKFVAAFFLIVGCWLFVISASKLFLQVK